MAQLGTKKSLTLAAAKEIGNAAEAKARELNFTNCIAVIDDGGNVIYQVTMDGTQMGSINVAVQKALAALRFKRSTKLFQDMVTGDKPHMAFLPGAVPVEGGCRCSSTGRFTARLASAACRQTRTASWRRPGPTSRPRSDDSRLYFIKLTAPRNRSIFTPSR